MRTTPTGQAVAEIPIEAVATYPLPGMALPGALKFTPDDEQISYLQSPDGSLSRQLYVMDLTSGEHTVLAKGPDGGVTEANLSLEEKLRRERQRQREIGIPSYLWSAAKGQLLVPLSGALFTKSAADGSLRKVVSNEDGPALDARFSPDGNWVSYVQQAELMLVPSDGGTPRQLTFGAEESGRSHGLAEFIAQEEMGRSRGYWWSLDSRWLAFTEVDDSHIPIYRILHQGKASVGSTAQEDHRYPFAGKPNAHVRLGVVSVDGGEPVWMDLGTDPDFYLARVAWTADNRLVAQRLNREQTLLELIVFDPNSGTGERLLEERSDVWINLHNCFRPLADDRFIWASERSGFQHLSLHAADGTLICSLTQGDWMVDELAGVDEEQEIVYFTGTVNGPREKHLYAVSFAGGEPRQVTAEAGIHNVTLDHGKRRFIDHYHAGDAPPRISLRRLRDGSMIQPVFDEVDSRVSALTLHPPQLVTLENRHGTLLHGAIYAPDSSFGSGPHPTVVWVYGGPHAQLVTNGWNMTANMRAQYLRNLGYLVFVLDNRGSTRRGLQFEAHIKHNLGQTEVEDQVDGVNWLVAQGLTDPERVGVYGWSYGGYMALICLSRAPETFKAAVAGAPVTHWDGYDTCYTERYMGTPAANPQGYEESSVMGHADQIKGKLLLIHGLVDENVHFRHTARLINSLIEARIAYDLLLFPDERHMPRKLADRVFMEEQIREFFAQNL